MSGIRNKNSTLRPGDLITVYFRGNIVFRAVFSIPIARSTSRHRTAVGVAALLAPTVTGFVFDTTGSYSGSILVSAAAAIAAGLLTRRRQLARAAQETQKLLVELGGEAYTARASHGGIHQLSPATIGARFF